MELLFARNELNEKPKKVQLDKIKEDLSKDGQKIFYFDRDNSHKDMMSLVDALEAEQRKSKILEEITEELLKKSGLSKEDLLEEINRRANDNIIM